MQQSCCFPSKMTPHHQDHLFLKTVLPSKDIGIIWTFFLTPMISVITGFNCISSLTKLQYCNERLEMSFLAPSKLGQIVFNWTDEIAQMTSIQKGRQDLLLSVVNSIQFNSGPKGACCFRVGHCLRWKRKLFRWKRKIFGKV